jgi:hypothetical protein
MRVRPSTFRVAITLLAALAIVVAGPVYAAHHHGTKGDDPGHVHAPCAVCQLHTPACRPLWQPCTGIPLEPLFVLAAMASPSPLSKPAIITGTRAPPISFA